ncbi:MAG TPA: hypothetical protein VLA20_08650 [Vicinamibacterales bacterium]|nr:hypothetical protein [Vicinamibacterales bacterium]
MRFEDDLEREIGRELSALDPPRAPATLLPRVMAAVARPWYTRAWLYWPAPAQVAFVLAMVASVSGLAWALGAAADTYGTASALMRIGWRHFLEPVAAYTFAMALVVALLISASWAALTRVALGGISE